MYIANNVLEYHLNNVYWIGGTACGGKTTMGKMIAEKYNMFYYNADDMINEHKKIAIHSEQPALCRHFTNWEEYFNRPIDEYTKWLLDINAEDLSMIIVDLLKIPEEKIIVEGHFSPTLIKSIIPYHKVIFLYAEDEVIKHDYFNRDDKKSMLDCIKKHTGSENTVDHILNVTVNLSNIQRDEAKRSGMKYMVRNSNSTINNTFEVLEKHFRLI